MDLILIIVGIVAWVFIGKARKQGNKQMERVATITRNVAFFIVIIIWVMYVIAKYSGVLGK